MTPESVMRDLLIEELKALDPELYRARVSTIQTELASLKPKPRHIRFEGYLVRCAGKELK
jgi:hypothetical protein